MADLILDVDYNITQAEAKQRKLDREFQLSQQKVDNIDKKIKDLNDSLQDEKNKQKDIRNLIAEQTKEAAQLARQIDRVKNGNAPMSEIIDLGSIDSAKTKLTEMEKSIKTNERAYDNSVNASKKMTTELKKQEYELEKQKNKTANIGEKIVLNTKKQNKFTQAFAKSSKSADRFGRRLKSLIASALFFSVVTKAFTALRNEFGKLINETGTKTASLVAQLNNNLAVLGRTLYESVRLHIEWMLEKLVHITQLITIAMAKALGKNVEEMKKLAKASKELAKNSEKSTANFDTLQKLGANSNSGSSDASSDVYLGSSNSDLEKTKKWLEEILPLVTSIGIAFGTWKIGGWLSQFGGIAATVGVIAQGIAIVVAGAALLISSAIKWKEELHNGENTLNSIIGTLGTILIVVGLIIAGVVAWPVLLIGAFLLLGIWYDNFADKVDKWISSLPLGIFEFVNQVKIAAYGVWDFIKNLFKGIYEIFTGDWEKGLKRIGITLVNLLVDALNLVINALNGWLIPLRAIISGAAKILGKNWSIKNVSIPLIPRIPQLATGAILPGGSPMLAWVNDQPKGQPYVEGSIENIAAAFEKYLDNKGFSNQNITIEAKGNWAQFIKWMNLQIKQENNRSSIWG